MCERGEFEQIILQHGSHYVIKHLKQIDRALYVNFLTQVNTRSYYLASSGPFSL